jgi:hypothetical protein
MNRVTLAFIFTQMQCKCLNANSFFQLLGASSLTVVHPSDEKMSKNRSFPSSAVVDSHGSNKGYLTLLTAADVPDFVHDGKLTINADIQIVPANKRISLN